MPVFGSSILNHCSDTSDGLGPKYGSSSIDRFYASFSADDH